MRRYFPTFDEFSASAQTARIVPVYRLLLADRLTPVSAFEVLGREQHAFLLESVVGGEKIGRYSFIAAGPRLVYQVAVGHASIQPVGKPPHEFTTADPLADKGEDIGGIVLDDRLRRDALQGHDADRVDEEQDHDTGDGSPPGALALHLFAHVGGRVPARVQENGNEHP